MRTERHKDRQIYALCRLYIVSVHFVILVASTGTVEDAGHKRNLRGVPVPPLFGLRGTVPHYSGQKVKNLM